MCSGLLFIVAAWLILCRDDDCDSRRDNCDCRRDCDDHRHDCDCRRPGCGSAQTTPVENNGCGCERVRVVRDCDRGCC